MRRDAYDETKKTVVFRSDGRAPAVLQLVRPDQASGRLCNEAVYPLPLILQEWFLLLRHPVEPHINATRADDVATPSLVPLPIIRIEAIAFSWQRSLP